MILGNCSFGKGSVSNKILFCLIYFHSTLGNISSSVFICTQHHYYILGYLDKFKIKGICNMCLSIYNMCLAYGSLESNILSALFNERYSFTSNPRKKLHQYNRLTIHFKYIITFNRNSKIYWL